MCRLQSFRSVPAAWRRTHAGGGIVEQLPPESVFVFEVEIYPYIAASAHAVEDAQPSPRPKDPTRPMVTLKTSWNNVRKKAGVTGRWHDNRHTLITDLAESGAADETIRDIAGHVSK